MKNSNYPTFVWIILFFVLIALFTTADGAHDAPECKSGEMDEGVYDNKDGL